MGAVREQACLLAFLRGPLTKYVEQLVLRDSVLFQNGKVGQIEGSWEKIRDALNSISALDSACGSIYIVSIHRD